MYFRSLKHKVYAGLGVMIFVFFAFSSFTIVSMYFSQRQIEHQQNFTEIKLKMVSELRNSILLTQKDGLLYINPNDSGNTTQNLIDFDSDFQTAIRYEGRLLRFSTDSSDKQSLADFDKWWVIFYDAANTSFINGINGSGYQTYINTTSAIDHAMQALKEYSNNLNQKITLQQKSINQNIDTLYITSVAFMIVAMIIGLIIARNLSGSILPRITVLQTIASHIDHYSSNQADVQSFIHKKITKLDELDTVIMAFHNTALSLSDTLSFQNALLDNIASDAFLVFDNDGKIVRCNDAFISLFGWEREEVIGKTSSIFFHTPIEYRHIVEMLNDQLLHGNKAVIEVNVLNSYGQLILMELSIRQIPELSIYLLIGKDIRERYAMEQQIREALQQSEESRKELQTIFNTVQDGIALFDLQTQFIQGNDAYVRMFSMPKSSEISELPSNTFYDESGEVLSNEQLPMRKFINGDTSANPNILRVKRFDDSIIITQSHLSFLYGTDDSPIGLLAAVKDITSQYRKNVIIQLMSEISQACAKAIDEQALGTYILEVFYHQPGIEFAGIVVRDLKNAKFGRLLSYTYKRRDWKDWVASYIKMIERFAIDPQSQVGVGRVLATGMPLFDMPSYAFLREEERKNIIPGDIHEIEHLRTTTIPLIFNGIAEGALVLIYDSNSIATDIMFNYEALLSICAEIAHSLNRTHLYSEAQHLALYDPLTGLFNHRSLQQQLLNALDQSAASKKPASLIMLDVDNFRKFNERYGHDIGDDVLRLVSKGIQNAIRVTDIAARYGGEEFTVILPDTEAEEAMKIAERIRNRIAHTQLLMQDGNSVGVTASLGYAIFPINASTPASLIKAADLALYSSKHNGRNRVTAFSRQILLEANSHVASVAEMTGTNEISLPSGTDLEAIKALNIAIDLHDGFTASHSESVSRYAVLIGEKMQLSAEELETLRLGGLIHDVGKIGIPDAVLAKEGSLTQEEWAIMRAHPAMGESIVRSVESLNHLLPIIRWHHERLDGSGYPDGLKGADIPMLVRIISITDTFDAFTAERKYHPPRPLAEGIRLLQKEAKAGRLDAAIVDVFLRVAVDLGIIAPESEEKAA